MFQIFDPTTQVQAFALSRQGSSHKRTQPEKPCQDACGVFSSSFRGEGMVVVVAADGHGSEAHDRSDVGAQLAVQAACSVFQECVILLSEVPEVQMATEFRDRFPQLLVRRWRELVALHAGVLAGTAATGPEISEEALIQVEKAEEALWKRYGTTLLFAGVYRRYLMLAQLGDGTIVVQHRDGRMEQPMPKNPENFAGHTLSLCARDARRHVMVQPAMQDSVQGVLLCTDGITDAYDADEKMLNMLRAAIENQAKNGLVPALEIMPEFLDRASKYGSGDDMTLAGLVFHAVPGVPEPKEPTWKSESVTEPYQKPENSEPREPTWVHDATTFPNEPGLFEKNSVKSDELNPSGE